MPSTGKITKPAGDWLRNAHTSSPLQQVNIHRGSRVQSVWLKLEMFNPCGSVKYRTALSLLRVLDRDCPLVPGTTIVESTSGNLGIALAQLSAQRGCRFIAVVDPKLPAAAHAAIAAAGAEVITVQEQDEHHGYLLTRLRLVRELCSASPSVRWANQYESNANPAVHRDVTGPELVNQTRGRLDMLAMAVSTGGTLAGVSEHVRRAVPTARILAVDVAGSVALSGASRPHLLTGIGASRKSSFLRPRHYDQAVHVRDIEALAACRLLEQDTGLVLGGSSGAVLAAFLADLAQRAAPPRFPVLLCPDGGPVKYADTIYSDNWLAGHGALGVVNATIARARRECLRFSLGEVTGHVRG
jgi:2,3-diaminopropionate biosynthesis protein SbnA